MTKASSVAIALFYQLLISLKLWVWQLLRRNPFVPVTARLPTSLTSDPEMTQTCICANVRPPPLVSLI